MIGWSPLTLALLVLWIFADDHHVPVTLNHTALWATRLHRCCYTHN